MFEVSLVRTIELTPFHERKSVLGIVQAGRRSTGSYRKKRRSLTADPCIFIYGVSAVSLPFMPCLLSSKMRPQIAGSISKHHNPVWIYCQHCTNHAVCYASTRGWSTVGYFAAKQSSMCSKDNEGLKIWLHASLDSGSDNHGYFSVVIDYL